MPSGRSMSKGLAGPIDTLFVDAGGVLVFPNWERVSESLARQGVEVAPARLAEADPRARHALDTPAEMKGTSDSSRSWRYFSLILEHAGVETSASAQAAWRDLEDYHARVNLWEAVPPEVPRALDRFRAMGLRLAVVSNSNGTVRHKLTRLGLAHHFHTVVDSTEEGVEKPDRRIFEIALERTGGRPQATVHVGDLYHVDVVGARAAAIQAALFDAAGLYDGVDCPRVQSLTALADALGAP